MRKFYFLITVCLTLLLTSFHVTQSYYSDAAVSVGNTSKAGTIFPTVTGTFLSTGITVTPEPQGFGIVINEIFQSSQNNNEWVELYNKTDTPIDVSGWRITDETISGPGNDDIFPHVPPIPAFGYALIKTSNSNLSIIPSGIVIIVLSSLNIGNGLNIAGDVVAIKNAQANIIDAMNYGNITSVFANPPAAPLSDKTLSRYPNGTDTDTSHDWVSTTSATLGVSNNL